MPISYTITKSDFDILEGYVNSGNYIEYYKKLEALGDRYATLAQGVASANSFEGNLARQYAENAASWKSGTDVEISGGQWLSLSVDLMKRDWASRVANQPEVPSGGSAIWTELRWDLIRDYHATAFELIGLPPEAWTAKIPLEANPGHAEVIWENVLSSTGTRLFTQLLIGLDQAGKLVDMGAGEIGVRPLGRTPKLRHRTDRFCQRYELGSCRDPTSGLDQG